MRVADLFESAGAHPLLIGSMLLKLHQAKKPLKVLLTGLTKDIKIDGKRTLASIPDQEWDISDVQIQKMVLGNEIRVFTDSPTGWFELNPEDDEQLTIKKRDGYWLLTSKDGKGVRL